MELPFTTAEFLQVFAAYNSAVWPAQVVHNAMAVFAVVLAVRNRTTGKWVAGVLAFFWAWMGLVYHIGFFTTINKAAYGFGALFVVQSLIFLYVGVFRSNLSFRFERNAHGITGAVLMVYALVAYPLLGHALGHTYPYAPTFGLPCPTTIFTFGLLLWADRKVPWWWLVIPVLWALIGTMAALKLGITEDLGLPVAALTAIALQGKRT